MTAYATLAQFHVHGVPAGAFGDDMDDTITDQLEAVSREADSYMQSRGLSTPLETWGIDLTSAVCRIAAPRVIFNSRGASALDPAHQGLVRQAEVAQKWLEDVAAGRVTPTNLTPARTAQGVLSVIAEEPRGW